MKKAKRMGFRLALATALVVAEACATTSSVTKIPYGPGGRAIPPYSSRLGSGSSAPPELTPTSELTGPVTLPSGYSSDQSRSEALTNYLKQHRLPLVGAQLLNWPDGKRAIVLYGYVGSEFGKNDAAAKAKNYLNDSDLLVDNRIKVEPQLLAQGSSSAQSTGVPGVPTQNYTSSYDSGSYGNSSGAYDNSGAGNYPDANSYVQQKQQAQQFAQQPGAGVSIGGMMPLLMLGMLGLSTLSGGSSSFGIGGGSVGFPGMSPFGGGMSPFGPPAYNPYSGYPSPPAGSYGGSPFGP